MSYEGQQLLQSEWEHFYPQVDLTSATKIPAMTVEKTTVVCNRCLSRFNQTEVQVPAGFFYCPACLFLARVTSQAFFYRFESVEKLPPPPFQWSGRLTFPQQAVAEALVNESQATLVWAVTGAGKTEMLYPLLVARLAHGEKILLTAPRIDVCNELYLRLINVFPKKVISLYHGKKRIEGTGQLVIATVPQTLRFKEHFALVIVDEVDAFPYVNDPLLQRAVKQAKTKTGRLVYLSATPDKKMLQELVVLRLPARFHRRKLPVPQIVQPFFLKRQLQRGRLPKKVVQLIHECLTENDVLLFCPSIELLQALGKQLTLYFPGTKATTVHARDEERIEKIEGLRAQKFNLLLTTTILERGVTFERVSVIVLDCSHPNYSKASLVQIAGRADRKNFQHAKVYFVTAEMTRGIKNAIREIKDNNQLARKRGLLDEM